ncbi:MAG TPA: DUF362 domain-containing protein [Candidatus Methylomirabilis sp.]|nr:DUF362 domain-containing protein [Candidatus Methylomirabilis sp.]
MPPSPPDQSLTDSIEVSKPDGIVAMEGNGPLNGTPRSLGKIVPADHPVAADTTCVSLMRFESTRIGHLRAYF